MIRKLYGLKSWLLPPSIEALGMRMIGPHWLGPQARKVLRHNQHIYQSHAGESGYIIATGPSIAKQDLSQLEGKFCISVSNFFVHPIFETIKPAFHCIAPYHPPITEDAWQLWMDELASHHGSSRLVFSMTDYQRNQQNQRFATDEKYFLAMGGPIAPMTPTHLNLTRRLAGPQSVTVMALYLALWLGLKRIYLIGCDHDWILHAGESRHFYEESKHALNREGYNEWHQATERTKLQIEFSSNARLWEQYQSIRRMAFSMGCEIYNLTEGGLLDVFPRMTLQSVVGSAL